MEAVESPKLSMIFRWALVTFVSCLCLQPLLSWPGHKSFPCRSASTPKRAL